MSEPKKVLIISLGGSPNQTIKSIEFNKPEFILFFCSPETLLNAKNIVETVQKSVPIKDYEKIVTESSEDIGPCYRVLMQEIPKKLNSWKCTFSDVSVDYTGGTKSMSAALVLATIENCNNYSYIGGSDRTKDGVGIVIDDKERVIYQANPWNELAVGELKVIDSLFNKARYLAAFELLEKVKKYVDSRLKDIYENLCKICQAYHEWDSFKHKEAKNILQQALPKLKAYRIIDRNLEILINQIESNFNWLNSLVNELNSKSSSDKTNQNGYKLLCVDLISNAARRGEKEQKYDDAVARLYSSLEKLAKSRLLDLGIDNSRTEKDQIPDNLLEVFEKHNFVDESSQSECYKYGFNDSMILLAELNTDFKVKYESKKIELEKLMNIRNSSILAHGTAPVSENTYKQMFDITMAFAGLKEDDLIEFPEFNLNTWGNKLLKE
ncbi:MAG: TIGR02710 family CRISPR-associated CARF protein [Clostridia bacterium]|nr:TIGR02710 family CRISPR-associated CARF protein [Clostridia bacterium]